MSPRRIVAFVGLRCAGKSSLARSWAARVGVPAFDLDELLLAEGDESIDSAGELLSALGKVEFRARESRALTRFLDEQSGAAALATGGGAVLLPENRSALGEVCLVVWLDAPAAVLAARLRADDTSRPSLTGLEPAAELARLATEREALYRAVADLRLDASLPPKELERELTRHLHKQADGGFVLLEDGGH